MLKYKNIFGKMLTFQIGLKKFLWFKKIKTICHGHNVISDLKSQEIVGIFYSNEWQKIISKWV